MDTQYRIERGLLWPKYDQACADVVFDTFKEDGLYAVGLCKQRRTVIQAGGNCGVWAIEFAKYFREVFTFEPDPRNYVCLFENTKHLSNVFCHNVALGAGAGQVVMVAPEANNCGALQVEDVLYKELPAERRVESTISKIALDSMIGIKDVDLIYLDLEGYEFDALAGADDIIQTWWPVIAFEDKGLSTKYGVNQGDTEIMLATRFGYRVIARRNRDVFMVR